MENIIGKYKVAKVMDVTEEGVALVPVQEAIARMESDPTTHPMELMKMKREIDAVIEFTADNKVIYWIAIPEGASEEMIKEALDAGLIDNSAEGYVGDERTQWKEENGRFYMDSKEEREIFEEEISPWDELVEDEEGLIVIRAGMAAIKRI